MKGSNLAAESMIRPVFPLLQGLCPRPSAASGGGYRAVPPAVIVDEPVRPTDEFDEHEKQRSSVRRLAAASGSRINGEIDGVDRWGHVFGSLGR
jgi:hypothetical protein